MSGVYIIIFVVLFAVPIVLGVAALLRWSRDRRAPGKALPRNADPVTLDRNPEMPHRPDATS